MRPVSRCFGLAAATIALAAPIAASAQDLVQCLEPRPQICTQEYLPVCANLKDNTKQTYATGNPLIIALVSSDIAETGS